MNQLLFQKVQFIELKIFLDVPVKIVEVQTGSILEETDIVRYKDIYGRIN